MISTLKEVREALEMLHTGLSWFKDSYPQDVNGSDDEAETEFQAALTKLDALIAATEKAEPVAAECRAIIEVFAKEWRLEYLSLPVGRHRLYVQEYSYTAPQSAAEPLTDEKITKAFNEAMAKRPKDASNAETNRLFVRAIEAAHKIGADK